jgi:hypothetical protein
MNRLDAPSSLEQGGNRRRSRKDRIIGAAVDGLGAMVDAGRVEG